MRFEQRTLTIPRKTEKLLLSASNWTKENDLYTYIGDEVLTFYKNDINGEHFRRQLRMVPYTCMIKCAEEFHSLQAVTTIRTVKNIITSS